MLILISSSPGGAIEDVTTLLGLRHPERAIGIPLNSIPPYKPYLEPGTVLPEVEQTFLNEASCWYEKSGAYDHIQKTAPQTVAYGLTDSPAGLAAWILQKFRDWGDCDGDIERRFTKDELLSNITLYWMTETIRSSCRLYYEDNRTPLHFQKGDYVTVPCGIARFPKREGPLPPQALGRARIQCPALDGHVPWGPLPCARRAGTVGGGYPLVFPSFTLSLRTLL